MWNRGESGGGGGFKEERADLSTKRVIGADSKLITGMGSGEAFCRGLGKERERRWAEAVSP